MTTSKNSTKINRVSNFKTIKSFDLFEKCLSLAMDKAAKETSESKAALNKCVTLCAKNVKCKAFKQFDANNVKCEKCSLKTCSVCLHVKNSEADKNAVFTLLNDKSFNALKAEAAKKVERDKYNFTLTGNHSKLAALLEKNPMKMKDIKNVLGNTYYCCVNKYPAIFAKSENKLFYVIGTNSEKLSIEIDKKIAKLKKENAAKIEKLKKEKADKKAKIKADKIKADEKIKKDKAAKKEKLKADKIKAEKEKLKKAEAAKKTKQDKENAAKTEHKKAA